MASLLVAAGGGGRGITGYRQWHRHRHTEICAILGIMIQCLTRTSTHTHTRIFGTSGGACRLMAWREGAHALLATCLAWAGQGWAPT